MSIISIQELRGKKIDAEALRGNIRKLDVGLISPATREEEPSLFTEHSAEAIKDMRDIHRISKYLLDSGRYRDYMLFITGINFGLRASDLLQLRFSDIINENLTFKDKFSVFEKKTRNTRKRKKLRYVSINNAVVEAVTTYLEHTSDVCLSDYMFVAESNNANGNLPITIRSVNRILKQLADDLGLSMRVSTHSLRKTFCYHQMVMSGNDSRKLLLLQKMLGHSTPAQTLDYIGITSEEIDAAYRQLNLGGSECYDVQNTDIIETDEAM